MAQWDSYSTGSPPSLYLSVVTTYSLQSTHFTRTLQLLAGFSVAASDIRSEAETNKPEDIILPVMLYQCIFYPLILYRTRISGSLWCTCWTRKTSSQWWPSLSPVLGAMTTLTPSPPWTLPQPQRRVKYTSSSRSPSHCWEVVTRTYHRYRYAQGWQCATVFVHTVGVWYALCTVQYKIMYGSSTFRLPCWWVIKHARAYAKVVYWLFLKV